MSTRRSCAMVLVAAALAAGCDDSPAAPTADQIAGTWTLVSIQRPGWPSRIGLPAPRIR